MREPIVVEAIRREIGEAKSTSSDQESNLDPALCRPASLPYVGAVFYETLRLYPPVPFELKQCEQATTLPDGTYLPKTAVLVWCTWAMNRSRLIWGADADVFRPERWLQAGGLISKSASEYPVFNGGPRTCLGKKMAELVAIQVIATLVMKFDFKGVDDKERISKNSLTLPMEGGLPCYVKLRTSPI
jgi:cytochrome P450